MNLSNLLTFWKDALRISYDMRGAVGTQATRELSKAIASVLAELESQKAKETRDAFYKKIREQEEHNKINNNKNI